MIPVVLDLTANHQGWFSFKICPNNDIWYTAASFSETFQYKIFREDPVQSCFDLFPLPVGKDKAARHPVTDYRTGLRLVYVHLPRRWSSSYIIQHVLV